MDTDIEDLPHSFSKKEISAIRQHLLNWYQKNKRDLPWRHSIVKHSLSQPTVLDSKKFNILPSKTTHEPSFANVKNPKNEAPIHLNFSDLKKDGLQHDKNIEIQQRGLRGVTAPNSELLGALFILFIKKTHKSSLFVWVSEIMLQQTQVATVIPYYERWMKLWPTVQSLANAELEKVNEVWAGLGYYSRAKRLHEGAKYICTELNGIMPTNAKELEKKIPGIGPYTAGAIASIAFQRVSPLVDGNVIRVLSRLRAIGGNPKSQIVVDLYWKLAAMLVDEVYPGDFNQAMMELGALICTPQTPKCDQCPIQSQCKAFQLASLTAESLSLSISASSSSSTVSVSPMCDCLICLTWDEPLPSTSSYSVTDFPRKPKKKAPKETSVHILLLHTSPDHFYIHQRPSHGLLAGLWEFPHFESKLEVESYVQTLMKSDANDSKLPSKEHINSKNGEKVVKQESTTTSTNPSKPLLQKLGEFTHLFSHIKQQLTVYYYRHPYSFHTIDIPISKQAAYQWVAPSQMSTLAISTGMKKVMDMYQKQKIWLSQSKTSSNDSFSFVKVKLENEKECFTTMKEPILKKEEKEVKVKAEEKEDRTIGGRLRKRIKRE